MLQTIVDRTVNVVFCSGVTLDNVYCMLYIVLNAAQLSFARLLIEKGAVVEAPVICKEFQSL